jgi:glycosyltransferase involved in cell wall biosynthesis
MFNGRKVDLVICTKFPSYMISHPNKVLWLIHQYRQLYDLYGSRFGDLSTSDEDEALRRMLLRADEQALRECRALFTISDNVRDRLDRYLGLKSETVVPPLPLGDSYYSGRPGDYILSVGRICSIKRVDLIIKAMSMIDDRLHLKVVGQADEPDIEAYIRSELDKHHLWHRVEFLGRVDDEKLLALYAHAFAVYYAPFDEDLGFVTMEALRSGQPVVTAEDSGGPLQYIEHEKNGLVVGANEQEIANGFNRLLNEPDLMSKLRASASRFSVSLDWSQAIERMVTPYIGGECTTESKQSVNR